MPGHWHFGHGLDSASDVLHCWHETIASACCELLAAPIAGEPVTRPKEPSAFTNAAIGCVAVLVASVVRELTGSFLLALLVAVVLGFGAQAAIRLSRRKTR